MLKGTTIRFPRWRKGDTDKFCGNCSVVKPIEQFRLRRKGHPAPAAYCIECADGIAKTWAKEQKERHRENGRRWAAANPEKKKAYVLAARDRDPERFKEYVRRYDRNNRELRREKRKAHYNKNRDIEREKHREWRLKNPHRNAFKAMMYEARKRKAMPAWADKHKILEIYACCAEMNRQSGFVKYHVDHIYPLCSDVMCGLHVHENLRIILAVENQRKSNRILAIDDVGAHLCGDRC